MRFGILLKTGKDTEAGVMPSQQLLAGMGRFNEELIQAGMMQAGEGLQPSSKGASLAPSWYSLVSPGALMPQPIGVRKETIQSVPVTKQ